MKLAAMIVGLSLVVCAPLTRAADRKGKEGKSRTAVVVQAGVSIFSEGDREIIGRYVRGIPDQDLPPGLARRGGKLPPGLEKQLRRKGTLPPGLQKRLTPFPVALEQQLPPLAPDLRRVFIEGRAIIFNSKTGLVLDVLVQF